MITTAGLPTPLFGGPESLDLPRLRADRRRVMFMVAAYGCYGTSLLSYRLPQGSQAYAQSTC